MSRAKCICEWPEGCAGVGVRYCRGCGGDQCVCRCGGELPCDMFDGCDECDVEDGGDFEGLDYGDES